MAILKDAIALVLHRPARAVRTGIGRVLWWFIDPQHDRVHLEAREAAYWRERARMRRLMGLPLDEADPGARERQK